VNNRRPATLIQADAEQFLSHVFGRIRSSVRFEYGMLSALTAKDGPVRGSVLEKP
jgi:hypothetical protein